MRLRMLLPLALAGSALLTAGVGNAFNAKDRFDLKGEVYPNSAFEIEMKNSANRALRTVKAGTYRIKVEDEATIHNFRLVGPGVNRATSIPRRAETIWTVALKPGTYRFLCDPHPSMRGSFRVTG